ncbi:hypothetical protein [Allosphingosinicella humi]
MSDLKLLWPDDVKLPSSRDGTIARLGGHELYFVSRTLQCERPTLFSDYRTTITRHILENGGGNEPVELMTHNIDAIINRRPLGVREKLRRLLLALARRTEFQVDTLDLSTSTSLPYSLCREAGLSGLKELISLLKFADQQGHVEFQQYNDGAKARTTILGLISLEDYEGVDAKSHMGFVAMWFGPEVAGAYSEAILPSIELNGYEAVRIDNREHNNKIDDEIISQIRRARFVVADFSCGKDGARGGVYFEAGFAMALAKPVIFTVRATDLARVHFDTRQYNHIVWETPADLKEKLTSRIGATIGPPVAA